MPEVLVSDAAPMPVMEDVSLETRLASSRGVFDRVRSLSGTGDVSAEQLNVVEEVLLRSDVGVAMTESVLDELRTNGAPEGVAAALRAILLDSFTWRSRRRPSADEGRVAVWLFVGVNGVGKTTTIGKLAKRQHDEGRSVLLAAGDTFRAAAADQLEQWATRSGRGDRSRHRRGGSRFGGARRDRSSQGPRHRLGARRHGRASRE